MIVASQVGNGNSIKKKPIKKENRMSLTLATVLDPQRLARDDYNLPAMLRRLIRQKERELQALVDKRVQENRWGESTPEEKSLRRELNDLRARSDLLTQLNLVT